MSVCVVIMACCGGVARGLVLPLAGESWAALLVGRRRGALWVVGEERRRRGA